MDVKSQSLLPAQQFVQFAEMHPSLIDGTSSGSASAQALACNLASILSFSSRSTADHLAKSLQLKLKNIGTNSTPTASTSTSTGSSRSCSSSKEMTETTDTNNNASPTQSPTNSLPRLNGTTGLSSLLAVPQKHLSPDSSSKYLLSKEDSITAEDETSDEDLDEKARMRRSSSLKSGKTPPGTPCRKKIVRFADALGLDLAEVRSFLDEIPNVPKSAYKDLDCAIEAQTPSKLFNFSSFAPLATNPTPNCASNTVTFGKTLVSTFHQPASRPDFFDRVRDQKVLLENAYLSDNFTLKGTVRVLNMDFHKSVYIRYTFNEWKTFIECQANYVSGSCDGFSDKFDFAITLNPAILNIGDKFTFAARFHCKGEQFWDSNNGHNYAFHVASSTSPTTNNLSQNPQNLYNFQHNNSNSVYSPMDDQWTTHMWM